MRVRNITLSKFIVYLSKMNDNERKIRARENWLKTYQDLGSITKASIKLGVSRSTLYRWVNRYDQEGKSGVNGK